MRPDYRTIRKMLDIMDWTGHCELPTIDLDWLADQLSSRLTNPDLLVCENCDTPREIIVQTALGRICESCLDELTSQAEEYREAMED